jgi:hypothetical protein
MLAYQAYMASFLWSFLQHEQHLQQQMQEQQSQRILSFLMEL